MTREDVNYIVGAAGCGLNCIVGVVASPSRPLLGAVIGMAVFFITMPAGFWVRDQIERRSRSGSNAH